MLLSVLKISVSVIVLIDAMYQILVCEILNGLFIFKVRLLF